MNMKILPLGTKVQGPSFGDLEKGVGGPTKQEKAELNEEEEDKAGKKKTARAILIPVGAVGLATILGVCMKSCSGPKPQDYTPYSHVGILDFNNEYDETVYKPASSTIDFSNPKVLADYKEEGLTLSNIIKNHYFGGEEGHEAAYEKIVSELDQANPGVIDNIFQVASSGKYETWKDVPFDVLINTNLDEVLDDAGLRFSDLNILSVNTPKVSFEFYDEGETDCESCKAQESVVYLDTKNEVVLIDPSLDKDKVSDQKEKTLKDAIVENYGVKPDSHEYYFILNMIANIRENEGLFEDIKGKICDANRAQILEDRKGDYYVHMPKNLTLIVKGGDITTSEDVVKNGDSVYYSNLLPEAREIDVKGEGVKTIEDLTQFYNHPHTGEALADQEMYDEEVEKYREAIMKTIIASYPQLFENLEYNDALSADISEAVSHIILPDVVLNFESGDVCGHTKQEQEEAPQKQKPSIKGEAPKVPNTTLPSKKPTSTTTTTTKKPSKPEPTKPQPTKPQPTKPQPTDPEPTKPQPTKPEPTTCEPAPDVEPETRPGETTRPSTGGGEVVADPNTPVTKPIKETTTRKQETTTRATTTQQPSCEEAPDVDVDW